MDLEKTHHKTGVSPEFKPQYSKKQNKKTPKNQKTLNPFLTEQNSVFNLYKMHVQCN
jgi:hypothetical protein